MRSEFYEPQELMPRSWQKNHDHEEISGPWTNLRDDKSQLTSLASPSRVVLLFVIYIANSPDNKNTLTVELELNRFIVSRFSYKETRIIC